MYLLVRLNFIVGFLFWFVYDDHIRYYNTICMEIENCMNNRKKKLTSH